MQSIFMIIKKLLVRSYSSPSVYHSEISGKRNDRRSESPYKMKTRENQPPVVTEPWF